MSQWGEPRNFRAGGVTFRFVPHVDGAAFEPLQLHHVIDSVFCENRSDGGKLDDDWYGMALRYAEATIGLPYSEWIKIPTRPASPSLELSGASASSALAP
ncbi:hypothetical protein [Rhodanobacter sp. OR92]|uniref:hypothetical protein n=1 Tax=Rhodanobacter sp. OR92 TaxID=1076524 RepID=UPI0005693D91|nr:hypothetical protein [Rhodanobacter sp. OR92]